jgi:hypothetical protein
LSVVLRHGVGGGARRFRASPRELLGAHAPRGNSLRVRHAGGPLMEGEQRAVSLALLAREPGRVDAAVSFEAEGGEVITLRVEALIEGGGDI